MVKKNKTENKHLECLLKDLITHLDEMKTENNVF